MYNSDSLGGWNTARQSWPIIYIVPQADRPSISGNSVETGVNWSLNCTCMRCCNILHAELTDTRELTPDTEADIMHDAARSADQHEKSIEKKPGKRAKSEDGQRGGIDYRAEIQERARWS